MTGLEVWSNVEFDEHERVMFCSDPSVGLRAIIALHRLGPGPSLGGTRMWLYPSEGAALSDALRLSRAMTYKAAMAGLPYGGAKAVILGDARRDRTPSLLRAMGQAIEGLGGQFVTGEDVGIGIEEVALMRGATRFVVGCHGQDSSPVAARGVFRGIMASLEYRGLLSVQRPIRVAVQGLGQVGMPLCALLAKEGFELTVSDLDSARLNAAIRDFGARAVSPESIVEASVDVLAPCAMGDVITVDNVHGLKAQIIAGAANNQLASEGVGRLLREKGVLYAPDYIINAGGLINNAMQLKSYNYEEVIRQTEKIGETLLEVYHYADEREMSTSVAADHIAQDRIARASMKQFAAVNKAV